MLTRKPVIEIGQELRDLPTYTIPEAAEFLAIPRRTLFYWTEGLNPIINVSDYIGEIALLSFRDLAEVYAIEVLRSFYGFTLPALREFARNARTETQLSHPFSEGDLYVVLNKLVLKKGATGRRPAYALDLSRGRNLVIPQFVEMIGERLTKDRKHITKKIYPWRLLSHEDRSTPVSLDPDVLSGRLVVAGTRIPVRVLQGMKARGKTDQEIAGEYRLSPETVRKALLHIERPVQKVA